jgi:XTP/dITP diphosphohydrolase
MQLLVASNNPGKLFEVRRLLADLPFELVTPRELGLAIEVAEDGATYNENARLKAIAFSTAGRTLAVADDSGIELADYAGWPGVHSVRFAGLHADDQSRREAILARLASTKGASRRARFVCSIAIARQGAILAEAVGTVEGTIAAAPRGTGGFGYDSIFVPENEVRTIAELAPADKDRISHRARAIAAVRPFLVQLAISTPDGPRRHAGVPKAEMVRDENEVP